MNRFTRLAALAPISLLAGCISFGGEAPEKLLTLTPTATAPAGTGGSGSQQSALAISEFEVPQSLDVTRVPVQINDTELAYLQDAFWVERPSRLFRRLVAETIRTQTGRVVMDGDDPGVGANDRLHGTLRTFGYDARSGSVVVVFDAVRSSSGSDVVTRRFEARVSGVPAETAFVAPALNQAANDVAGQIADWMT